MNYPRRHFARFTRKREFRIFVDSLTQLSDSNTSNSRDYNFPATGRNATISTKRNSGRSTNPPAFTGRGKLAKQHRGPACACNFSEPPEVSLPSHLADTALYDVCEPARISAESAWGPTDQAGGYAQIRPTCDLRSEAQCIMQPFTLCGARHPSFGRPNLPVCCGIWFGISRILLISKILNSEVLDAGSL